MTLVLFAGVMLCAPLTASGGEAIKDVTLQPGSNESTMNFCWQSNTGGAASVHVATNSGSNSAVFPSGSVRFTGTVSAATKGYFTNKVTVSGLSPETEYIYSVGNGTVYSSTYHFKTGNSDTYNAIFVSDAQIGASGSTSADKASWEKTLSVALGKFPGTSFMLSAGDQVDYFLESEYDAFLASPFLRSYPIAPAVGNHENLSKSALHANYYNEPNESTVYGLTPAGGDYWFRYGSTLYLVLNTNNTNVSEHEAFIAQTTALNPNPAWTILMFHQSIYSSAVYSNAGSSIALRKALVPVIDKYHIDVVLSGHDHCYTRTYQMLGGTAQKAQSVDALGRIVNPTGTVYITADSASGSKYYDMKATPEAYAAVRLQLKVPTFTNMDFTNDTLTITTYRTDTMNAIDTYSIVKQNASGFIDVPSGAWFYPAVTYLSSHHITDGTTKTTFSPELVLTRSQCLVLLMKAYGIAPETSSIDNFADAGSTWYTGYLASAKRLGLVSGTGNNNYLPEANISRQDMFVLIYNALVFLDKLPAGTAAYAYNDENAIAAYAKNAINVLSSSGVISGSNGRISPTGLSSRAEMAQVLYKLLSQ